ncbi:hypothetical protein GCM10022631_19610 [Deinococcus rubellus]
MNNLRVELSKLRSAGIILGTPGSPLLAFEATSDLQQWLSAAEQSLSDYPALQGRALSGLEAVGETGFQHWVIQQREALVNRLSPILRRSYAHDTRPERRRLIEESAARIGVVLDMSLPQGEYDLSQSDLNGDIIRLLQAAMDDPQLLVFSGWPGSGRRSTLSRAAHSPWKVVDVDAVGHSGLMVAAMVMRILEQLASGGAALPEVLDISAQTPEKTLIRLASLLQDVRAPLVLVIHGTRKLSQESFQHLEFLMNCPVPLLMVLMPSVAETAPLLQVLAERSHIRNRQLLVQPRLRPSAVLPALEQTAQTTAGPDTLAAALKVIQQSEGWLAAAQEFLPRAFSTVNRFPLPVRLRSLLLETGNTVPGSLETLARLAGLRVPLSETEVADRLPDYATAEAIHTVLGRAQAAGMLVRRPTQITVVLPDLIWNVPDGEHPLGFDSELQRAALAGTLDAGLRARLRSSGLSEGPRSPAPLTAPVSPLAWQPVPPLLSGKPLSAHAAVWLPGGYHLIAEDGQLHVLRLGVPQPNTQELLLTLQTAVAMPWSLTGRLDSFAGGVGDYPLGVCSGESRNVLDPAQLPAAGQWFRVAGTTGQSGLKLTLRAYDLILTIREITLGGQVVPFVPGNFKDIGSGVQH